MQLKSVGIYEPRLETGKNYLWISFANELFYPLESRIPAIDELAESVRALKSHSNDVRGLLPTARQVASLGT